LQCVVVCCSVLQCVAVCCSVLQCVAVCCSVLQCVTVCCSVLHTRRASVCVWNIAYRVATTHRIPYLYRSFSAKVTYICGSSVENDERLRGSYESWPPCTTCV